MDLNVLRPIKNEADYEYATSLLDKVIDAEEGTVEATLLDVLALQIAEYEDKHHKIEAVDAIDLIEHLIDNGILTLKKLEDILGCEYNRVWEYRNRKRRIPLEGLQKLNKFGLPADVLLQPYDLAV